MQKLLEFIANHYLLVSAFGLALIWLIVEETRTRGVGGGRLTSQAVTHLLNREQAVIIDVRDVNAFKNGHIVGAINVPAATFGQNLKTIEKYKQRPMIVVCGNGQQSPAIMSKLRKQGFAKVHILTGGVAAWKSANLPLVKK